MASINTQTNLISQAMMNNSERELDKLDELKSAHSIHDAVEKGNFETFKYLIDLDVNLIDAVDDEYGRTPLIICSYKKTETHYRIVKCLLDSGCDVNIQANYKWNNWTALMTASFYGNTSIIELLINANANLELIDIASNTAWQLALENAHNECVQIILNEMENKQIEVRLKLEKDLQDSVFNNDFEGTELCLKKINKDNRKQVINSTTSGNHTLLYRACRNGNPNIVRLLIDNGAIARPHYYTKYSPLYISCHMGNFQISKMILEKFPHLIRVKTIEKFLPFHAVCSQGHLEILKLLVIFNNPSSKSSSSTTFDNLFSSTLSPLEHPKVFISGGGGGNSGTEQKYLSMFDLNSLDVNDQSGLYAAVVANKYEICEYLINMRVKQLTEKDLERIRQLQQEEKSRREKASAKTPKTKSIRTSESSNGISLFSSLLSSLSNDDIKQHQQSQGNSFFDHLKNVFLDTKSPSENITTTTTSTSSSLIQIETTKTNDDNEKQPLHSDIYFNPININQYSKFGSTCLHEAIRNKNYLLVNLLLTNGANANLPIYDVASTPNADGSPTNSRTILSNCLCESIKQLDEHMFLLILDHVDYNEFDFRIIFKLCLELMNTKNDARLNAAQGESLSLFGKKMISYMMQLKIANDSEFKINIRNKIATKHLNNLLGLGASNTVNVSHLLGANFDCGLILNWNSLEPKLVKVYESWLHNSTKYFKFSNRNLNLSAVTASTTIASSRLDDEHSQPPTQANLSLKKLHFHVITRVDFSNNNLEQLPFALFQIESLKYMKLSFNKIAKLPTCRNYELDDVNKLNAPLDVDSHLAWNCNLLEEFEVDNNKLVELPSQLFQLKSLKHLNVSNNLLEKLPIEMWSCPVLFDFNASYNKLTHLPLISSCYRENLENRGRAISNPIAPQTKNLRSRRDEAAGKNAIQQQQKRIPVSDHPLKSPIEDKSPVPLNNTQQTIVLAKEKTIEKANFWSLHSVNSCMEIIENNDDLINADLIQSEKSTSKLKSKSIQGHMLSHNQRKESKLVELNLSNNNFSKVPECLSCLTPKLVKLNLNSNKIESMGAICDLPLSLKFLDLSNNLIKRPMRLLNESLLKFIIYYFSKYTLLNSASPSTSSEADTQEIFKINNILINLLLENEFCYFNLVQKFLENTTPKSNTFSPTTTTTPSYSARPPILPPSIRSKTRAPQSKFETPNGNNFMLNTPITTSPSSTSTNLKRRTRSQSRNQQKLITTTAQNSLNTSNSTQRVLPFDLFLINLRYNRSYANAQNETNFDMSNLIDSLLNEHNKSNDNFDLDHELDKKEKLILNSQNLQIFLEQLCPHKRHIKLDNLKSLNLSQNRIKKCSLMLDLTSSLTQINANNISMILPEKKTTKQQQPTVVIVAQSVKSAEKVSNHSIEAAGATSDSDFSESEDLFSSDEAYSSNDEDQRIKDQDKSKKSSKAKLKDKLSTFSPLKKKLHDSTSTPLSASKTTPNAKKKSLFYLNKSDEKASMVSKLMFPNLTHLDLSSNRLRRLPGSIALLENLSYLNSSSNPQLLRVSPQIGLLNKLWNFDLKNCPALRDPVSLNDLVKQRTKTSDILGFLKSILEHSRSYTRIKLMFVGVQAIGKTTLLTKLREEGTSNAPSNRHSWSERSNPSQPTFASHVNISTVGIDINEWVYEKPKQKYPTNSTNLSPQLVQQQQQQQGIYIYQMDNSMTMGTGSNGTSSNNNNNNKSFGPVTFRTWDFGGQREYYSTHQYFISKRALYLVCWKLSEEEKGINEIHHWLSNIQTRAPGSPVIIVGTHQDQLAKLKNCKEISNYLQRLIYERFVRPSSESETTSAYPPIMASIEISSKTGHNIKALAKLIYDVASQMKSPQMKDQLLLEQKIPLTYLALEECISFVLQKLKSQSRNPVLNTSNYLKEIRFAIDILYPDENDLQLGATLSPIANTKSQSLKNKRLLIRFRDDAEILQATQFLHDNGILIHYNDVALRDLFFLDPQWLCDILATVITIREINPFAAKGIMKIKDLLILFKGSRFTESEEIMSFIVDLLGKFELALTWDNEHLLIPSLLPSEAMLKFSNQDIRINIVSKQKAYSDRQNSISYNNLVSSPNSKCISSPLPHSHSSIATFPNKSSTTPQEQISSLLFSNVKLVNSYSQMTLANKLNLEFLYECKPYTSSKLSKKKILENLSENIQDQENKMQSSLRRLYCLSYLPNGIFSRLITRILCDNILKECLLELIELEYCLENETENESEVFENDDDEENANTNRKKSSLDPLIDFVCQEAEWKCWQTGIELKYLDYTLIRVKELVQDPLLDFNGPSNNYNGSKNENGTKKGNKNNGDMFLNTPVLYRDCENEFKIKSSSKQCAFLECYASFRDYKIVKSKPKTNSQRPSWTKQNSFNSKGNDDDSEENDNDTDALVKILCNRKVCTRIFALIIEIIDSLLEDWYPDLGTRFMQDSKGDYLVTRLAPCVDCIKNARLNTVNLINKQESESVNSKLTTDLFVDTFSTNVNDNAHKNEANSDLNNWNYTEVDDKIKIATILADNVSLIIDTNDLGSNLISGSGGADSSHLSSSYNERKRYSSISSTNDSSSNFIKYENYDDEEKLKLKLFESTNWIFCFMLDDVCYSVLKNFTLTCPKHGTQSARVIAPDIAFEDIDDKYLVSNENLKIEALIGRGSFGSVFCGSLVFKNCNNSGVNNETQTNLTTTQTVKVAVKVLETLSNTNSKSIEFDKSYYSDLNKMLNVNDKNQLSVAPKLSKESSSKNSDQQQQNSTPELKNLNSRASFNKYWNYRKSIRLAAKAYVTARQEIAIINSLKHENIIAMIGLSIQPLAILLELAPLGNLKEILLDYKANMCKLNPTIIQRITIQISSALVYLHSNRIIYRDLKADNVLVWKFPRPSQTNNEFNQNLQNTTTSSELNFATSNVNIKLADYSISRSVLPTGTKGFAGTPGFMAPEILKFNGEETYSEKVDCFSFGMLLYELITLKHPFDGQEQIKDIILNGGRPLIKSQDLLYPTLMLDLMCLCWLDNPADRPSAENIHRYTKSYEFSHLLDVTLLEDYEKPPLVITCLNQEQEDMEELDEQTIYNLKRQQEVNANFDNDDELLANEEIEEEDAIDVWIVRNSIEEATSQLEVLTYENKLNCTCRKVIDVSANLIESMCIYNRNQIWCIDASKNVYIYCCRTFQKITDHRLSYISNSQVVSMIPLESMIQMCICTVNGSILLLKIGHLHEISLKNNRFDRNDTNLSNELEYTLVDLHLKVNTCIIVPTRFDKNYDLWMGSEHGEIFCFSLKTMNFTGSYSHSSSHHYLSNSLLNNRGSMSSELSSSPSKISVIPADTQDTNVTLIKATQTDTFFIWSYVYPGSTIFLWNHVSKKIMSAYNCRKAYEELNFKEISHSKDFRVVDMTFLNGHLYCGINNGIVIVLKRLTLTPLLIFQAHMHQLHILCPITFETYTKRRFNLNPNKQSGVNNSNKVVKRTQHMLLTLGRALAPLHEDIYLSSNKYRVDALRKYASCLILNAWNSN